MSRSDFAGLGEAVEGRRVEVAEGRSSPDAEAVEVQGAGTRSSCSRTRRFQAAAVSLVAAGYDADTREGHATAGDRVGRVAAAEHGGARDAEEDVSLAGEAAAGGHSILPSCIGAGEEGEPRHSLQSRSRTSAAEGEGASRDVADSDA